MIETRDEREEEEMCNEQRFFCPPLSLLSRFGGLRFILPQNIRQTEELLYIIDQCIQWSMCTSTEFTKIVREWIAGVTGGRNGECSLDILNNIVVLDLHPSFN